MTTDAAEVIRLPERTFAELGLYDAITAALTPDRWLEHGVVEHLGAIGASTS